MTIADRAVELRRLAVGPDDGQPLAVEVGRDEHLGAAGHARRHADGVAGGAAPAVDGQADEVQLEQLAELAGELEPGLVAAVIGRRRAPLRT